MHPELFLRMKANHFSKTIKRSIYTFCFLLNAFNSSAQVLIDSVYQKNFKVFIHDIVIEGNKKTKPQIIFRQLTFFKNDSISFYDLQKIAASNTLAAISIL